MTSPFGAIPEQPDAQRQDDIRIVAGVRSGDESVFSELFTRVDPMLRRLARTHVSSAAVAEEVVQETWLAVINGIDGFQGHSSLVTWIASILANQARRHGARERRSLPFAALGEEGDSGASVDPSRFQGDDATWPGHWATPSRPWQRPERRLLSLEVRRHLRDALQELPERQRVVIGLRDIDGCSADEVCTILGVSAENQRVLLHRARSRLREVLDGYMQEEL